MSLRVVREVPSSEWWDLAERDPAATFFHSPLWQSLVEGAYPEHRSAPYGLRADGELVAVLPCTEVGGNKPLGITRATSSFAGAYGGVTVMPSFDRERAAAELYEALLSDHLGLGAGLGSVRIVGNPFGPTEPPASPTPTVFEDFTQVVALDRPFKDVLSGFGGFRRRNIGKARRAGVAVREASELEGYRELFDAYRNSLERWEEPPIRVYPWDLFESGFHLSRRYPAHLKLWLATVDEAVASAAWIFYWNDRAAYWQGAFYPEFSEYRPNDLLHTEIMRDAREHGCELYDLLPSGGIEGVIRFKEKFGAEKRPLKRWRFRTALFTAQKRLRRKLRELF